MKYCKKPVFIEAIQWTGLNLEEIRSFVGGFLKEYKFTSDGFVHLPGQPKYYIGTSIFMFIETTDGEQQCMFGDYIIKDVNGEFYLCKPDIFEKTYEIVE
jgi:hypothetical protein